MQAREFQRRRSKDREGEDGREGENGGSERVEEPDPAMPEASNWGSYANTFPVSYAILHWVSVT